MHAAEAAVKAAHGERYPTANITADYGDVGPTLNDSHGTFTFIASASVKYLSTAAASAGEMVQAQAALKQRQDELADLAGDIAYQIRTAFLDIRTAAIRWPWRETISIWRMRRWRRRATAFPPVWATTSK